MIQGLTVINDRGEQLKIDLFRPLESGFLITNIEGLGPGKATINTTEMATYDGSLYNSSRANQRNIVITFKYLDVPTIEDVRYLSYKYFPLNRKITLIVETTNRVAEIDGWVESNEPDIFSDAETASISIICPYPYFKLHGSAGTNVTVFYGVDALFEFPFENADVESPLLEFGAIQQKMQQNIYYDGDAEVGMKIVMHALGEVGDVTIYNMQTREQMRIPEARLVALTGKKIVYGDTITINTNKGEKSITLERDGITTNILNVLDKGTSWLTLRKGDNLLSYAASSGAEYLEFKIENQIIYEGV